MRFADRRTRLRIGSRRWFLEDIKFRVPKGARYAAVMCILGMNGTAWFDSVSFTVPRPLPWETAETKNYVFHWLPEKPLPPQAMQTQQRLFDEVCSRLGIHSPVRIQYYFYPDSATIRRQLGLKGAMYVSWTDRELHTVDPIDRHEFIHFITDPYGQPPRAMAEGLVYYLSDNFAGYPVDKIAAYRLHYGQLVPLSQLINYGEFVRLDRSLTIPVAASLTGFLIRRFGTEKYLELLGRINGVNSWEPFASAIEAVYGMSMVDIEGAWKAYLRGIDFSELPKPGNVQSSDKP
ncbi:MAG: hypothetical protein D6741_20305 [Planctomycetota bacterium]|nr:MAG: hypothetical protein D6741_20305 [Planctomycetota bacterium]